MSKRRVAVPTALDVAEAMDALRPCIAALRGDADPERAASDLSAAVERMEVLRVAAATRMLGAGGLALVIDTALAAVRVASLRSDLVAPLVVRVAAGCLETVAAAAGEPDSMALEEVHIANCALTVAAAPVRSPAMRCLVLGALDLLGVILSTASHRTAAAMLASEHLLAAGRLDDDDNLCALHRLGLWQRLCVLEPASTAGLLLRNPALVAGFAQSVLAAHAAAVSSTAAACAALALRILAPVVDYSRGITELPLRDPAASGLELMRAAFQMMGAVPGRGPGAVELGGELAEAAYLFVAAACRASLPIDAWRVVTRDLLQGCIRPLADFCAASTERQPITAVQMRVTAAAAHCLRTALYVCPRELDLGLLLFSPRPDGGTASVGDLLLRMVDSVAPASDAAGGAAAGIRIIKAEAALCVAIVASYSLAHQTAVARAAASLAAATGGGEVSASVSLQRAAIAVRDVDVSVFVGWTMLDTRGSVVDGSHDDAFAAALEAQPQEALRTNGDLRRAAFVKYILVRSLFGCIQRCHAPEPTSPRSPARAAPPIMSETRSPLAPAPDPRAHHFIELVLRLCTAGAARHSPPRAATAQVRELASRAGFSKAQRAKALELLAREAPRARVEPHKRHWSLADVQRGDLLWFSIVVPDLETAHVVQGAADSQPGPAPSPRLARRAALHVLSASIAAAITATQEHLLRINHHAQICPVRALSRRTFLLDLLNNVLPALVHLLEFLAASLRESPDDFSRRLFDTVAQGAPVALGEVDDDESVAGCVRYRFASLTPENFLTTCDAVRG